MKWLHLKKWTSAESCEQALRSAGYQIVVTDMTPDAIPIQVVSFVLLASVIPLECGLDASNGRRFRK